MQAAHARPWILALVGLSLGGCVCCDRVPRCAAPAPAPPAPPAATKPAATKPADPAPRAEPDPPPPAKALPEKPAPGPVAPEAAPELKPEPMPEQATAAASAAADLYQVAKADVDELKRLARSRKALNEDLLQYLDAVMHWCSGGLRPPEGLDEVGRNGFARNLARTRKETEKLLLRCLTLELVQGGHNLRTDVNIAAATKLGQLAPYLEARDRERLSKKLMRAIEQRMTKVKGYVVSQTLLEESFLTLAQLNALESLEWMLKEFVHTKERELDLLRAAHKAMPLFQNVPGKLRYEVVDEFLKAYATLELRALKPGSSPRVATMLRVWTQIRPGAIAVVRRYAGDPRGADGKPLGSLRAYLTWFRNHKHPRREPWLAHR